jgi:adenine-specific DNA-methyltransferase
MPRNKADKSIPVETLKHKDKRKNIPTEELRDFVAEDEKQPKTMLYPRDPSLDPQLVWKGKDEQDSEDLAVPVVPVYIQEKIHPQALIEDFRSSVGAHRDAPLLFADFNGLDFERMVEFYQHEQNWSNRMILGDSLLVMTSLAEKEGLKGKVQMIYIDPPYGIKFGSNWQVSTRKRDVKDGKAEDATRQPEQIRAFRDTWKLGIHSYLAYLRDRLTVARELLTESGSVFVQIGDENVHLVRSVMDEVFGSENFCALITLWKTSGATTTILPTVSDYLLWYAKNIDTVKYRQIYTQKELGQGVGAEYKHLELPDGTRRPLTDEEVVKPALLPSGSRIFRPSPMTSQSASATTSVPFDFEGVTFSPGSGGWKTNQTGFTSLVNANRIMRRDKSLSYVRYLEDFPVVPVSNLWLDTRWGFDAAERIYVVQTNVRVTQRCLLMTTDPGDLVLDPTCGSGTTAYVAEQWGRRWITIDTSRVALALARTRLMAARYPYYVLADSPEGIRKEAEITGQLPANVILRSEATKNPEMLRGVYPEILRGVYPEILRSAQDDKRRAQDDNGGAQDDKRRAQHDNGGAQHDNHGGYDIKKGFVYKRVPHVTLKSIANNPDIKAGMSRAEIDAAIARHADTELLYDQPYEDNKKIRVTGPFTVESLSPYRLLSTEEERPASEAEAHRESSGGQFATMIIDNLRKAGVQNTFKNERLKFDRLEPYAGSWIHATGEYTEKDGKARRVAVSIGPEHGTVGTEQVKEAAKEAVQGVGFDLLIVCGFAFDPHVSEEAKRYGKLMVMPTRMNYDLTMGDDLLKKTGAGNLFMYFGEPDIEVKPQKDGKLVVKIKGLDIYDPTTGQIRSHSTDDIACWFIDTNYNGESFFVRHAYFTGAEEPYEKLKRALRAEIDEAAWSALYSTASRPFDPPKTGKIAIKVINHYGDEVLKVYDVRAT